MKRHIKGLLVLALLSLGLSQTLRAVNTNDALTVTITPNAFYAVDIDTANVSLDMGAVDLSASTQTVRPSTVTIQSTYATTDLRLQGSIASGGTPWTFDATSATLATDQLAAWATFTSIALMTPPTQTADYFSGTAPGVTDSDMIDATNRYVGTSGAVTGHFENNSGVGSKDMDALPPDPNVLAKSHLWLYFRLPNVSTTNNAQDVTITLTAVAPF